MKDTLQKIFWNALGIVGIFFFIWLFLGMGFSHTYNDQRLIYLDGAQNVLIARGLCKNQNDCAKKEIIFGSGSGIKIGSYEYGGVSIYVYETSNPEVVADLVKVFKDIYQKQKVPLTLKVYKTKSHDYLQTKFAQVHIE